MQRLRIAVSILMFAVVAFAGPSAGSALAGQEKVDMCHLTGNGEFNLISIAEPAVEAHLAHGDHLPDSDGNCDSDQDGIFDNVDNCPLHPNPDQADHYGAEAGDACEDLDGDGMLDVDEEHFCLSIDGNTYIEQGTAQCYTHFGNVAVANGDGAVAEAYSGNDNSAIAIGNNAFARAAKGNGNSAEALRDNAFAHVFYGDNNVATANGDSAVAEAYGGNNNSATSDGPYTCAGNGDSGEIAYNEDLCH